MTNNIQADLFEEPYAKEGQERAYPEWANAAAFAALYSDAGIDLSRLPPYARRLFDLSVNAFSAIVHARVSEFPIAAEIQYFEQKVFAAANAVNEADQRRAAERAANDRGDPQVQIVLDAAYKAGHEVHRLMGLLRFYPDDQGVYIARCEPDYFILPALGPHFKNRFGKTPWAVIDEKRRLCLRCESGAYPELFCFSEISASPLPRGEWENLWRHYHKIINNESRNNPALQRQFMPKRYWKYLTELQEERQ